MKHFNEPSTWQGCSTAGVDLICDRLCAALLESGEHGGAHSIATRASQELDELMHSQQGQVATQSGTSQGDTSLLPESAMNDFVSQRITMY